MFVILFNMKEEIKAIIKELIIPELGEIKQAVKINTVKIEELDKNLSKRIDDTNKRIDDTNKRIDDLRSDLREFKESVRDGFRDFTSQLIEIRQELATVNERIDRLAIEKANR